jgi:hypothetical protein
MRRKEAGMNGEFELLASRAVSRAHLLEKALHSCAPWQAVVYGQETECRLPASRHILEDEFRIVFTAHATSSIRDIHAVELYCGNALLVARQVTGLPSAPCRIVLDVGIEHPETVR